MEFAANARPTQKEMDKSVDFLYSKSPGTLQMIHQEETNMKYVCNVCGWVYDEDEAGVKWEDLPDDFACELCGVGKEDFSPEE